MSRHKGRSRWSACLEPEYSEIEEPANWIAPRLMALLEENREALGRQGQVLMRPDRDRAKSYRLRFRAQDPQTGVTVHRSIPLGTDVWLACAVDKQILAFRRQHWESKNAESRKRVQEAERARQLETMREQFQELGHSRRQRRDIGKEFDQAAQNPADLFTFAMRAPHAYRPRQSGRPRKRKLW